VTDADAVQIISLNVFVSDVRMLQKCNWLPNFYRPIGGKIGKADLEDFFSSCIADKNIRRQR